MKEKHKVNSHFCNVSRNYSCFRIWIGSSYSSQRYVFWLTKLTLLIAVVITAFCISQRLLCVSTKVKQRQSNSETNSTEKIVIGITMCAGGYSNIGRRVNQSQFIDRAVEPSLTLIKSILISAKLANAQEIEFHIFTDSWMANAAIETKIREFQVAMDGFVKFTVHYHNVYRVVPQGYEKDFIETRKRCGFVRVFFPDYFPNSLKQILYLDTDVIVTGNILQIWKNFMDKVIFNASSGRPPQLAALIPNMELDGMNYFEVFLKNFRKTPHVPPRGVNSGIIFMNLDAMRKQGWTNEIRKIVEERKATLLGDQQLINVYFHDKLDRLTLFPCQYNFQHLHCERGLLCKTIEEEGIQIMHGAGGMYNTKGRSHFALYQAFTRFNLTHHQEVTSRLFDPLRNLYSKSFDLSKSEQGKATCFGLIGKYLFKYAYKMDN